MGHYQTSDADLMKAVKARVSHGSIRAAAAALGMTRAGFQSQLDRAAQKGLIAPRAESNPSRWRPGEEIVAARKAEYQRVKASAPNRDGNTIFLPDDGPFMVIFLGDEHLDNPGTDLALFERWISFLNRSKHITGWSMGDMLDNWLKPLAHLYATAETPAPEGWILLEHYMEKMGEHLDCSIGGNHDAWSGHSDVLAMLMNQYDVMHRTHSLKVTYRTRSGRDITINGRHSWPGRSMWNPAHGVMRAARMGVRDNILVGGHTHITGSGTEVCPMTRKISHCFQIGSFKRVDDYVDQLGLHDGNSSPALALIIDPSRDDSDPEMVKHYYDPEVAADYLSFLRRKRK